MDESELRGRAGVGTPASVHAVGVIGGVPTLLTRHGAALLAIVDDPDIRVADLAQRVGVTERTAYRIVGDLNAWGYLRRVRIGRRNHYELTNGSTRRQHLDDALRVRAHSARNTF